MEILKIVTCQRQKKLLQIEHYTNSWYNIYHKLYSINNHAFFSFVSI